MRDCCSRGRLLVLIDSASDEDLLKPPFTLIFSQPDHNGMDELSFINSQP